MTRKIEKIVISKGEALFWLDKNGRWHNKHGAFQHKRIIDYFHSAIRKDSDGYYLSQSNGNYREKVYFNYEGNALFVFDIIKDKDIILVLNTKKQIKLRPQKLFLKDDDLFMQVGEDRIKFVERGLIKISDLIEYENKQYFIRVKNRRYKIHELK